MTAWPTSRARQKAAMPAYDVGFKEQVGGPLAFDFTQRRQEVMPEKGFYAADLNASKK
jgi:hypothetical protein